MKRLNKKLSLFLAFCMVFSVMTAAGPLSVWAADGKAYTVELSAEPADVWDMFAAMVDGDSLAYEKRDGAKVLEAVKADGNLTIEVWPGKTLTDNQAIIRTAMYALKPGDTLLFHEGRYGNLLPLLEEGGVSRNNSQVYLSGEPGKPITIKGYGNGEARPVITSDGVTNHDLWTIYGSYIDISYMMFTEATGWAVGLTRMTKTEADTGLITDISIKDCVFDSNWDCGIAANWSWYHYNNITIENNVFKNPFYTYVYIGQADGRAWGDNVVVRNNFFVGGPNYRPDSTGYALEYKKNVNNSLVENNLVIDMKGPGIAVYGADTTDEFGATDVKPNILRNNLVLGSGEGINALGGPVRMYQNVAFENEYMGIRVQQRSSQTAVRRDMQVYGNTSGYNGYDAWEPVYTLDYSNLGEGSTTITDLASGGSKVENNIYYADREIDADSIAVQCMIKAISELTEKPAGFDAYFADLANNPGPYTMQQLIEKFSLLVSVPSESAAAEMTAVVTTYNNILGYGLLDTTKSLAELSAAVATVAVDGVKVSVDAYDYFTYTADQIIDLPHYAINVSKGSTAYTVYLSGDIKELVAARSILSKYALPNDAIATDSSIKAALNAALAAAGSKVTVASATFADEKSAVKAEIGSGFITFDVALENTVTSRAMFVAMLYEMAGSPAVSGGAGFSDADGWSVNALAWASANGIVVGTGKGLFNPNAAVTRQDMVVILQRYADNAGVTLPETKDAKEFADDADVAAYAKDAAQALFRSGVINSSGDNFNPLGTAPRASAAAILKAFADVAAQ